MSEPTPGYVLRSHAEQTRRQSLVAGFLTQDVLHLREVLMDGSPGWNHSILRNSVISEEPRLR